MVPKPVKAVIIIFPITKMLEDIKAREDQDAGLLSVDPNVIWIKQRVRYDTWLTPDQLFVHPHY